MGVKANESGVDVVVSSAMVGAVKVRIGIKRVARKDKKGGGLSSVEVGVVEDSIRREETLALK